MRTAAVHIKRRELAPGVWIWCAEFASPLPYGETRALQKALAWCRIMNWKEPKNARV